jgi:hypothetical protein
MAFKHGLSDNFAEALNDVYAKGGWWKRAVDDPDLIPAIRNEYVNVYCKGNSLWRIERRANGFHVFTHFKYMLRNDPAPYVESTAGADGELDSLRKNLLISSASDLTALKSAARAYASNEKSGVHQIAARNRNVIDLEVAFSTLIRGGEEQPADEEQHSVSRIDIVALDGRGERPRLVFYEAKTFDDSRLRSRTGQPEVLAQMARYEELLNDHAPDLAESYRHVCKNLLAIRGFDERWSDRRNLLAKVVELGLDVETKPFLVIFGYSDADWKSPAWEAQYRVLEKQLGANRVVKAGEARNIKLSA